jgi:hypothetical protein
MIDNYNYNNNTNKIIHNIKNNKLTQKKKKIKKNILKIY